ncbi:Hint domain-containing protein [Roseivivax sp. GX 12232]|uniref:Hint domain-containing protein n=1 Tax=Roseivivax sp. GX 12232 TaxID=2900547 RepID=UPI001E3D6DF7|nr:Hint domain-containing protein [Roseivivax sp. GX 12232]MCE0505227.1 Hint domain-containing protein [Roseivivax sp. GX 12232]
MRRYEAAALLPDLTVEYLSRTAPAHPVFEETAGGFARGTLLQTPSGPVAVEDLVPGDYVETSDGAEPVIWIGSTSYVPRVEDSDSILTTLYRVTGGAFGPEMPGTDMVFGPAARFLVRRDRFRETIGHDSVFVPLADYADGERVIPVQPGGSVQIYHVALAEHKALKVGNLEIESYHPGPGLRRELGPGYLETFLSLFPGCRGLEDFGELSRPRTSREAVLRLGG